MTLPRITYSDLGDEERALAASFPAIDWLEPQPVETPAGRWLTCRLCTAAHGLKASNVPVIGHTSHADWEAHVRQEHCR